MNREVQVRFCERLGVKLPGPTRLRARPSLHRALPLERQANRDGAAAAILDVLLGLWLVVAPMLLTGLSRPAAAVNGIVV